MPLLVRRPGDGRVRVDAGVVHEDVQPPGALDGLVDEARRVLGVGDRCGDGERRTARGLDRVGSPAQRAAASGGGVEVARRDDDGRAVSGHRESELASDSPASAGHEGHLAGEVKGGGHFRLLKPPSCLYLPEHDVDVGCGVVVPRRFLDGAQLLFD